MRAYVCFFPHILIQWIVTQRQAQKHGFQVVRLIAINHPDRSQHIRLGGATHTLPRTRRRPRCRSGKHTQLVKSLAARSMWNVLGLHCVVGYMFGAR
jgi:hypothetical protein